MEIVRTPEDVNRIIDSMIGYIEFLMEQEEPWYLVGIANGGIPLCAELNRRLEEKTGCALPTGIVNVSFHRDDIGSRPITRPKAPTQLPFEIQNASIVLVDDVLHSGRTIRAALDELFEHGRPRVVKLVTMVDRGHRVVPIQPDFSAYQIDLEPSQNLRVIIDPEDSMGNRVWVADKD